MRLTIPEQHQKKIALSTLRATKTGALIMGGMNHKEAYIFLNEKAGWNHKRIQDYMRSHGHDYIFIQNLMAEIYLS